MSIKPICIALAIVMYFPVTYAQNVEFNAHILDADDRKNIDLSAFSREGYVAPGEYLLDILLNGHMIRERQVIHFVTIGHEKSTAACLDDAFIGAIGLKPEVIKKIRHYPASTCNDLRNSDIHVKYSADNQSLSISVPQAWLEYQDENWIPPAMWDNGINGFVFDYNLLANRFMPQQGVTNSNYSLYGTTGFNIGAWRLRSDYQYNLYESDNERHSSLTLPQTYLFRPFPGIRSRLTVGQSYLNSDIFDSFRFAGVSLVSDSRMLPPSLRGYAPQISGIARTHAQVTVSQNGRILWQSQVPAGPFVIPNLSETVRGNLDVTVREDNGNVQSWQVNTASVPFLARKGNILYKTAIGKPLYGTGNHTVEPFFSSGEMTWGAFNDTSLYGGFIVSDGNYRALALGVGENMGRLGAASFDVTQSTTQLRNQSQRTGYSYRFNYAKTFDQTGSTIAFAGYRFSDKNFISMNQYLDRENDYFDSPAEKQSYILTFNQSFQAVGLSLLFSASRHNYWNAVTNDNYTVSLNKAFNIGPFYGSTASLSLGSGHLLDQQKDNQIYLSLTLPFGTGSQFSYAMQNDSNGRMEQTATLYNHPSDKTSWNMSVGQQRESGGENSASLSGDYQRETPYGQGDISFSKVNQQYSTLGLSWYGSFTATRYGAAFHQNIAGTDPRLMIDTDNISGVPVDYGRGITNRFGIAVVPGGNSYERSDVTIDVTQLPADISVPDGVISKVLTEGAIGYKKIKATKGGQLIGTIRMMDGKYPPFGTMVKNHNGETLGMVGNNGFTYLSGLTDKDYNKLRISWTGGQCLLNIPKNANLQSGVLLLPCD